MTFGLTNTGFKPKRYADILPEKERRARELFGNDANLSDSSPLGMLVRLNAWDEAAVWQQMEEVYLSAYVSSAEGVSLDRKCQDIGIMRQLSTRASGTIQFSGADGTQIFEGFEVQTATGVVYRTTTATTISGALARVDIEAVDAGVAGNVGAGAISRTVSPLAGVTGVTNPDPTSGGRDAETDAQLRERYVRSVSKPGGASAAAIEAALLDIEGVLDAEVRQNVTLETDPATGIPPKAIAPIVWGGDADEIADTLYTVKPAGIQCWGEDEVHEITDSRGRTHVIGFDRPDLVTVNVSATLTVDTAIFPLDGDTLVGAAIEDHLSGLALGEDVIYTRLISRIHSVPGIIDIPALTVNGGTGNIAIAKTGVAVPGTITVTSP
ncbi:MAG: baseplate J/gp47 family protein [Bacilli bacterium]